MTTNREPREMRERVYDLRQIVLSLLVNLAISFSGFSCFSRLNNKLWGMLMTNREPREMRERVYDLRQIVLSLFVNLAILFS